MTQMSDHAGPTAQAARGRSERRTENHPMSALDGAFGPVTYTMPYHRLRRLSRTGGRRSYPRIWWFTWVWIGAFLAGFLAIIVFRQYFDTLIWSLASDLGWTLDSTEPLVFGLILVVFFAGLFLNRRRFHAEQQARVDFDEPITLRPAEGGLHFAGPHIEYILKWPGIRELLREPDGIVLIHGGFFFLVPDRAFASLDDRRAFLDHVAAHLTPEARARSAAELEHARRS